MTTNGWAGQSAYFGGMKLRSSGPASGIELAVDSRGKYWFTVVDACAQPRDLVVMMLRNREDEAEETLTEHQQLKGETQLCHLAH